MHWRVYVCKNRTFTIVQSCIFAPLASKDKDKNRIIYLGSINFPNIPVCGEGDTRSSNLIFRFSLLLLLWVILGASGLTITVIFL